jgi:hypothetical protein
MGAHQLLGALDNCSPGETGDSLQKSVVDCQIFCKRAAGTGLQGEHTLAKKPGWL